MMKFFRRFRDLGISGNMARRYDIDSNEYRLEEMRGYAAEAAKHVTDGCSVLEIAPGPGYLSIELAKIGSYKITGMDISEDFVKIAKQNADRAGVDIEFLQGNVSKIPMKDNTFDFIICTAAFKNFKEPIRALTEMIRVLKPEKSALIIDMDRNATNDDLLKMIGKMGARGFSRFMQMTIFKELRSSAYTKDEFSNMLLQAGITNSNIRSIDGGLWVYMKKC